MALSISSLLALLDFGLGNWSISSIAASNGNNREKVILQVLRTVRRRALVAVALILGPVLIFTIGLGAGISALTKEQNAFLWANILAAGAAGAYASLSPKIDLGLGRATRAAAWQGFAAASTAVAQIFAALLNASVLTIAIVGVWAAPAVLLINLWLAQSWQAVGPATHSSVLLPIRTGSAFLGLQLVGLLATGLDVIIVSSVLGIGTAGVYSAAVKFTSFVGVALYSAASILWPMFAEMKSKGHLKEAKVLLIRSTLVEALLASSSTAVIAWAVVRYWGRLMHGLPAPSVWLIAVGAVWACLQAISSPLLMCINGFALEKVQLGAASRMAIANFLGSIALSLTIGVTGPIVSSIITNLAFLYVPMIRLADKELSTDG